MFLAASLPHAIACRGNSSTELHPAVPSCRPVSISNQHAAFSSHRLRRRRDPRHCRLTVSAKFSGATAKSAARFGRFSPANDIRLAMLNFRYEAEVAEGLLVIRPLTAERLGEATELLTDVFATSNDVIGMYSRYMRGQIRQYLENHLRQVPDAIVLMALLHSQDDQQGTTTAAADSAASAQHQAATASPTDSATSSSAPAPDAQQEADAAELGPDWRQAHRNRRAADDDAAVFVGTVEMAYTEETRTQFLTLNPPKDSAYLGNCCVDPAHRRKGYGRHLLAAAEQLTQLAAYPEIFLHLRFKDEDAAAMYRQAGYRIVERDSIFRWALGLDRRYLMNKDLPPPPPPPPQPPAQPAQEADSATAAAAA